MLAAAAAVAALAAFERLRFAGEAIRIGAVTPDRLDRVASHWTVAELLVAVTAVVAAVAWLAWFARVYGNLPALGARWTTVSRSNGVLCCALPVLNLFMAPKLWLESWRASEFDSGPGRDDMIRSVLADGPPRSPRHIGTEGGKPNAKSLPLSDGFRSNVRPRSCEVQVLLAARAAKFADAAALPSGEVATTPLG